MLTKSSAFCGRTSNKRSPAVVLFVYRRPHLARQVLTSIRRAQPKRLYFIADAAKSVAETEACELSRQLVEEVDWPCEIRSNLADEHLGCARRISTGVEWVFGYENSAIFLEDDCIADPSFFDFATELLDRYASHEQIMTITGFNILPSRRPRENSYYFSNLGSSWGWATWKRAWMHFDPTIKAWRGGDVRNWIRLLLGDDEVFRERARLFDEVTASRLDSWAIPWNFACLLHGGCCAVPAVNLIKNIGFGPTSTHHKCETDPNAGVPISSMGFPLTHPATIVVDKQLDQQWNRRALGIK